MAKFILNKGYDLNLDGKPNKEIIKISSPDIIKIDPHNFKYIKPKILVKCRLAHSISSCERDSLQLIKNSGDSGSPLNRIVRTASCSPIGTGRVNPVSNICSGSCSKSKYELTSKHKYQSCGAVEVRLHSLMAQDHKIDSMNKIFILKK